MNTNIRYKRLKADYEKLNKLQERSPFVRILETQGNPPEVYRLALSCRGIREVKSNGAVIYSEDHRLQIKLPHNYPGCIPEFQMLTPVWHPNISGGTICMGHEGDRGYVPSMGLDDLVVRIIQIIRYENYSREFALNHAAFTWAQQNSRLFPLDDRQIILEDIEINLLDELRLRPAENRAEDDLLGKIRIL